MIKKILIANRGEIAVRVIRTCREMNIKTVAVYSEVDRAALFVQMADEAYLIGPAPASESYLCIDKILAVAKKSKADAVHPGYGFLSENANFSAACKKADLIFLGPTPKAILAMGDKVTARTYAQKSKMPMVPGTLDAIADVKKIAALAKDYGYPVILKAASGGGGKGMRVVRAATEIESAFKQATDEAVKSFGDGRVYLEKYVENPRHVEVQIAADQKGNAVALFERECSMQRRHQKVIEEAPCVYLKSDVREKMMQASVKLALDMKYTGVGTVEYLVDADQNFYFLEMNTRLQVEHCVTEMITGLDLVRMQIEIGQGQTLSVSQKDLVARGHAIEARIYAEDPAQGFMPSPGYIQNLQVPEGPGIRHDSGVQTGSTITIHYDPMVAKLIAYAPTREAAIAKLLTALRSYHVRGLKTNVAFLQTLLSTPEFKKATMHTQFIDQNPELSQAKASAVPLEVVLGAAAFDVLNSTQPPKSSGSDFTSLWWQSGVDEL